MFGVGEWSAAAQRSIAFSVAIGSSVARTSSSCGQLAASMVVRLADD